ncbi:hypothetical protein L833_2920 [Mycobacteroides abscessus MAB_091912_2446]|uniref:Uncharacterized protein n=1 Tax=Mycobacteroides abscessus MAB_091912_2446 TaxID=1335414 RepID=A0A829MMJ6_9MYCO|nr:hypothetical protein L833_2920 [Mycobacteroides abscessus MAB_091912_2446]
MGSMSPIHDLLGPEPVLLPGDDDAESALLNGQDPAAVAAAYPRRRSPGLSWPRTRWMTTGPSPAS